MKRKSSIVLKKDSSVQKCIVEQCDSEKTGNGKDENIDLTQSGCRKRKSRKCILNISRNDDSVSNKTSITKATANQSSTKKKLKNLLPNIRTLLQDSNSTSHFLPASLKAYSGADFSENELISADSVVSTKHSCTSKTNCVPRIYAKLSPFPKDIATSKLSNCPTVSREPNSEYPCRLDESPAVDVELPDLISEDVDSEVINSHISQNEKGFVELSVANIDQSPTDVLDDECQARTRTNEVSVDDIVSGRELNDASNDIAINEDGYSAETYYLLVDEHALKNDIISSGNLDPSVFNCDLSMSSVATDLTPMINQRLTPSVEADLSAEDEEIQSSHVRFLNSVDLSIYSSESNTNSQNHETGVQIAQTQSDVKCVLDQSEKLKRKGSAADKWNRRKQPKKQRVNQCSKNANELAIKSASEEKPETFAFQWTDEEVELLKRNIENCANFHKCTPEQIIHGWSRSERGDFYRIVATGIDRPLNSIYRKCLRLYPKPTTSKGKFSADEIETLKSLHSEHGPNWIKIGSLMNRNADSVRDKYRCLKCNGENEGCWSETEIEKLKDAVENIYGKQQIPILKMNWKKISELVASRTDRQCRGKWIHSLYTVVRANQSGKNIKWTTDDTLFLLEKLCTSGANCEDDVDWAKVAGELDNLRSPQWIRRLWAVQLKPTISNKGDKISFKDALTKLQKFFHECNQLFQSGLDVCEEMLISSYTSPCFSPQRGTDTTVANIEEASVGDYSRKFMGNEGSNNSYERKRKSAIDSSSSGACSLTLTPIEKLSAVATDFGIGGGGISNESCINMLLNSEEFAFNHYYDLEEEFVPSEEFVNLD